ncbi:MAG: hypothetical protein QOF78_2152, partial [Phycisphaerales bacterium]|nr:hypothetical protein [Phycisphaerales bacterium]
ASPTRSAAPAAASVRANGRTRAHRGRRGLSIVLVVIVLVVLFAFVSLAVDVGRVKVAKTQLQTTADAAAAAAASGLELFPTKGIAEPEDRALEVAALNRNLDEDDKNGKRDDKPLELIADEDMEFGRWDEQLRQFIPLQQVNGGIDERGQADTVRVWARRVTRFTDSEGNIIERGTGVPLIFTPVLPGGPLAAEIQAKASALLKSHVSGAAFIGLEFIKFNGSVDSDSYAAATENYPGVGGQNRNSSFASNGDIRLAGRTKILGSVHPGINRWILPQPLGGNVDIRGLMLPLADVLARATPAFHPLPIEKTPPNGPQQSNEPGSITPLIALVPGSKAFEADNDTQLISRTQPNTTYATNFVFSSWTSGSGDRVTIDNTKSPIEIWVDGEFRHIGSARVEILSNLHPVIFHINGKMELRGRVTVPKVFLPQNLQIFMCKANTTLDIGGSAALFAHINAPSSDIVFHGKSGGGKWDFYGFAVGKSLTVATNAVLHYDESEGLHAPTFSIRLVE